MHQTFKKYMAKEKVTAQVENPENEMTTVDGGVTAEQVAEWKAKHGRVVEIEVGDPDYNERHVGYFRRPDMKTMQAFSATAKNNEVKAAEIFFDNCWLGGSPMMKTDAVYKLEANGKLQAIFGKCVSKLKNL